jgi:hypothetical protein
VTIDDALGRLQEMLMKVQVDTAITIKIDDVAHKMSMADARRLHTELGKLFPLQHYHPMFRYAENRVGGGVDPLNGKYSASARLDPLDFEFEFQSSEG